ncbi:hypothetical protein MBLNU459_g4567t1 [Dothideomycetes sp. NU459]
MASALQQQLAAIAANSTNQLDLKAQRVQHSKSLLFDSRDAANQTFDTIYQLCAEGFQELCMLDPRFAPFAQNLFSEQSKSEERIQMTAKQNQDLDAVIESFLGLVGGRLLLRPGLKALEWLVRRFRVHEYNTECLILTFLPYHTNPVFPTMLSILPKTLPPAFKFLTPYVTSLSAPPRHAVLYAAINNPGFFTSFNRYIIQTATQGHHSAPSLGFWASITAQAINGQLDSAQSGRADVRRQREEDLLLRVIPVLQETLRIRNVPELFLGSCMIITILVTKTQLEDKVLDGLMDAVVKSWSARTLDDGLTCLSVIAEERQSFRLPRATTRALLKAGAVHQRLSALSERQQVGRLYAGLAVASLDDITGSHLPETLNLVEHALNENALSLNQKSVVIAALLTASTRLDSAADPRIAQEHLSRIFSQLSESPETLPLVQQEAARSSLSIESLEMQLQISLAERNTSVVPISMDVEMEQTGGIEAEAFESVLASLPESLGPNYSFLDSDDQSPFDTFARAFLLLLQQKRNLDELLNLPALHGADATTKPTQLSFLARLCTSPFPVAARAAALRAATSKVKSASTHATDLQALVPFALVSLVDSSEVVRRSAADLLLAVSASYHASQDKGKVSESTSIWGQGSLYGQGSKQTIWLSSQDAYKILSTAIVPTLEECVLDPAHLPRVITNALNSGSQAQNSHTSAASVELKSSLRASLFAFVSSHAASVPLMSVRVQLLSLLAHGGKAGSSGRAQVLIPSLREWVTSDSAKRTASCAVSRVQVSDVNNAYIACLTSRTAEELGCLKALALGELGQESSLAIASIHRFKHLWSTMKPGAQNFTATLLLDLSLDSQTTDAAQARQSEAVDVLRQITLTTEVLSTLLDSVPNIAQMEDKPPATKRRRTSRSELAKAQNIDVSDLHEVIRRLTLVLELIEGSKPERHPELLKSLFHVLSELQQYKTQLGSSLVYLQQLVISCLLSVVESLKQNQSAKVDRSVLRADLIVECVRSSSNAQVHNAALLLISSLASWVPDLVLHSVMPIFTFMSNTLLRQSDDYSAHIIDQTVSRVVPPLVASLRKKNENLIAGSAELLLSFTAAFEHIPLHRRLRLFSHLVNALGPQESLPAIVAMLVEKYPTDTRVPVFSADLMNSFSPLIQVTAAIKYLDLVQDALKPKRAVSEAIFGFNDKTLPQINESIEHLLKSLARLLENRTLHSQIVKTLHQNGSDVAAIQSASASLLEKIMGLSKALEGHPEMQRASKHVLIAALGLLPTEYFISTAKALLEKPDHDIRRMVLTSLELRGKTAKVNDTPAANALLDVLPHVTAVISQGTDMDLTHSAVICVDVVAERFGKKDMAAVLAAAQVVSSASAFGSSDNKVRIISLLCLATMVEILRDDLVPLLPQVLNQAFQYVRATKTPSPDGQQLHNAVYSFLSSVLEYIPWMFSAKTLDEALHLTQESASNNVYGRSGAANRDQFSALVSKQVEAREILSALERTFDGAISSGYQACSEMLRILQQVITTQPKAVLIKHASVLFSIVLKSFDLRRRLAQLPVSLSDEEVNTIEAQRDSLTLDAVMRLNDATFRPFFTRLVEWATEGLPKKDESGRIHRLTSLYGFLAKFFESLKSVVTGYSSYVLEQTAIILGQIKPSGVKEQRLLKSVLETLSASFDHDQDDFWQAPSHFEAVVQPLLDQLVHAKEPEIRESLNIVPAITRLAGAAASPDHHKTLNTAILRMMRHDDALVRVAAVKCEQELTEKLGEDWLSLLPEMLPFISELQEDDDEEVDRETMVWIRSMEEILGESLEGMLQ